MAAFGGMCSASLDAADTRVRKDSFVVEVLRLFVDQLVDSLALADRNRVMVQEEGTLSLPGLRRSPRIDQRVVERKAPMVGRANLPDVLAETAGAVFVAGPVCLVSRLPPIALLRQLESLVVVDEGAEAEDLGLESFGH